jgi:hypothetical protein
LIVFKIQALNQSAISCQIGDLYGDGQKVSGCLSWSGDSFSGVFNKLEVEREQVVQHAQRPIKLRCPKLRVGNKSEKYGMITNAVLFPK